MCAILKWPYHYGNTHKLSRSSPNGKWERVGIGLLFILSLVHADVEMVLNTFCLVLIQIYFNFDANTHSVCCLNTTDFYFICFVSACKLDNHTFCSKCLVSCVILNSIILYKEKSQDSVLVIQLICWPCLFKMPSD